jgi:hypothetical protein
MATVTSLRRDRRQTGMHGLPLEVIFLVISHFRYDVNSLRACSLVHRGWRHFFQRCLFNSHPVPLSTVVRLLELVQALQQDPLLAEYITRLWINPALAAFLRYLQGRLPRLKTLAVKQPERRSYDLTMDPAALSAFAESCSSLEELSMDGVCITPDHPLRRRVPFKLAVRSLLTTHHLHAFNPLVGLVRDLVFPFLKRAHLTIGGAWDVDSVGIAVLLSSCASLREVYVEFSLYCSAQGAFFELDRSDETLNMCTQRSRQFLGHTLTYKNSSLQHARTCCTRCIISSEVRTCHPLPSSRW